MDTSHPPPTPRFPPRAIPAGQISEPYTNAELRLIHYVNSVVRGSDEPGIELAEAVERLRFDAAYYTFRDRERAKAELDERTLPADAPQPIAPVAPADPGLSPCKGQPLSSEVCGDVEANCCTCGGG